MEGFFAKFFTLFAFAEDIAMFITTPIHILVLITLWKNRKEETLKQPFFKLMISIGIADVCTIINRFFTFRLAEWGWTPQIFIFLGGLSSRIAFTVKYFFGNSQTFGVLVVAVNRYTAFMMPLRHQKLWRDGKLVRWSIACSWIIALLSIIPILFIFKYRIYISPVDPTNRTIYLQWANATELLYYSIPMIMIGKGLLVLFIFILYGIIFVVTFKIKCTRAHETTEVEKAALNMSIVGFVHCIGLAITVYFFIAEEMSWFGFRHRFDFSIISFIHNLGNNLFSAINPYALLIFSESVRTKFFKMYRISMISIPFMGKKSVAPLGESTRTGGPINHNVDLQIKRNGKM